MDKINTSFIGLGRMGTTHLSILNQNPHITVTSVCDHSKIAKNLFKKYFSDIRLYSEYKEMLDKGKPNAVVISTPPAQHYKIIKDCIDRGIHVFVEKPFTLTYRESSSLSELAEKAGIINQVGYVNRFNDVFVKAKEMLNNDTIGRVTHFKAEMFTSVITKEDTNGWREKPDSGGGCLNEVASHAIDLINYILGTPVNVCGSVINKVYSKNVDDMISGTLLYKNGLSGTLYVNWSDASFKKASNKFEINGIKGKMVIDQHGLKIYLNQKNEVYDLQKGWNTLYITDIFNNVPFYVRGNEFTNQLYHFIDCIRDKDMMNRCTFADASLTHNILDLIRKDYMNNYWSSYADN